MWVLCSPTRDQTHTLYNRRRTLNHWTAREFPRWILQSVQQRSLKPIHSNGIKECCNECVNGGKTNIFPSRGGVRSACAGKDRICLSMAKNMFLFYQLPIIHKTGKQNLKTLVWTRHVFPLSHKFSVCSWNVIVQILVISDNSSGAFPVTQW